MSQKNKILELLLDAFPGYVTNFDFNEKICYRYSARLMDLKKDGWEIENKQNKENPQEWRCRLLKPFRDESPKIETQKSLF